MQKPRLKEKASEKVFALVRERRRNREKKGWKISYGVKPRGVHTAGYGPMTSLCCAWLFVPQFSDASPRSDLMHTSSHSRLWLFMHRLGNKPPIHGGNELRPCCQPFAWGYHCSDCSFTQAIVGDPLRWWKSHGLSMPQRFGPLIGFHSLFDKQCHHRGPTGRAVEQNFVTEALLNLGQCDCLCA